MKELEEVPQTYQTRKMRLEVKAEVVDDHTLTPKSAT